jgi:RNA polymerase sigma-70 factor (ECF subfamily)
MRLPLRIFFGQVRLPQNCSPNRCAELSIYIGVADFVPAYATEIPSMKSSDHRQRARAADVARLWLRHSDRIYGYILVHTRNIPDADDIFQNVGLAVVEADEVPLENSQFLAWSYEVARRRILKFYRQAGRAHPLSPEIIERMAEVAQLQAERESEHPRREALQHCLQSLPAQQRELLAAHYGDPNLDAVDLANRFGRTIQGIYSLLYRVRQLLKECVERRLQTESI